MVHILLRCISCSGTEYFVFNSITVEIALREVIVISITYQLRVSGDRYNS